MTKIEQVASAVEAAGMAWVNARRADIPSIGWADVPSDVFARAAIEAMREPTEAMYDAGYGACLEKSAFSAWDAMIDAALIERTK